MVFISFHFVVVSLFILFHVVERVFFILSHVVAAVFLILFHVSEQNDFILFQPSEIFADILSSVCFAVSATPVKNVAMSVANCLIPSHTESTKVLKTSQLLYRTTSPATRAAIAPTTIPIGFAIIAADNKPKADVTPCINPITN